MEYDFSTLKKKEEEVIAWLQGEYTQLHTGRVNPAIVDKVQVEVYGAKTPVIHIASVVAQDAKTLLISPYDEKNNAPLEEALRKQFTMFSVSAIDKGVLVILPDMSEDQRVALKKLLREKKEEAKISLRNGREKILNDLKHKLVEKSISEDEYFSYKEKLQENIDASHKKFDEMYDMKSKDIEQ